MTKAAKGTQVGWLAAVLVVVVELTADAVVAVAVVAVAVGLVVMEAVVVVVELTAEVKVACWRASARVCSRRSEQSHGCPFPCTWCNNRY